MKFDEMIMLLEREMSMGHICQPLLIKTLMEAGGSATLRQLALAFLSQDETRLICCEDLIKQMPLKVLGKRGIVSRTGDLVALNTDKLTPEQKTRVKVICERKIREYAAEGNRNETDSGNTVTTDIDPDCLFCPERVKHRIVEEYDSVFAIRDGYPVSEGHHLIIPKRHTADWFAMGEKEQQDANALIRILRNRLAESDKAITGYNIGMNCGESGGQSIFHAHIHLIPRRDGDAPNPRGGVRGVIPRKMGY